MKADARKAETNQGEGVSERETLLELDHVRYRGTGETSIRLNDFSDHVRSGELVRVALGRGQDPRDAASLMLGLNQPLSGEIRFEGKDWLGKDYSRHFAMRSRIGRVFAGSAWIQSLTLGDNVRLAMSHHRNDRQSIRQSVKEWTERFGGRRARLIRRALKMRPSFVEPSVLQVCQLIRAFCCGPRLLLLERPLRHASDELITRYASALNEVLAGGAAVVWFAGDGIPAVPLDQPQRTWRLERNALLVDGGSVEGADR